MFGKFSKSNNDRADSSPSAISDGKAPKHLSTMDQDIDIVETTTKNPYREPRFIGTYVAASLSCTASFAGYIMPITAIQQINAAIGPSPDVIWIALAWVLCSSVAFTLIGRLSDIFGRRYFFVGCSGLATLGCIVGCTANHVNQLIAASVLLGLAAAGQISFNYVLGELVPVRHRYAVNALVFVCTFPFSGLGPYLSRLLIVRTSSTWRGIYYVTLALNATATVCWLLFYFPPKFEKLHRNRSKMQELREIDFVGIILFTGGLILFLMGLSWGGVVYPWKSAHVIVTIITGIVALVLFVLYDTFVPLRRPLVPMHLFRNYDFDIVNVISIVGGVLYYAGSVLFPHMVASLYTNDIIRGGLMSCAIGGGVCGGQLIGSLIAVPGGHMRFKMMFVTACLTAFTAGLAGCTESAAAGSALATLVGIAVGVLEAIVSTTVTIVLDDQSELGTGAGVFGSVRGATGVIATAIYSTVLLNSISRNIQTDVVPALVQAGLPLTSIEGYLAAVQTLNETAIMAVPGVNGLILETGSAALHAANASAFKLTWLATLAFGLASFIAACLSRDIDAKLSHDVIRRLTVGGNGKKGDSSDSEKD